MIFKLSSTGHRAVLNLGVSNPEAASSLVADLQYEKGQATATLASVDIIKDPVSAIRAQERISLLESLISAFDRTQEEDGSVPDEVFKSASF